VTPPAPPALRITRRFSYVLPFRSLLIGEPPRPYTPVWLEYGLLGMRDLFHHFAIVFEEPNQQVLLQPLW